MARSKLGPLDDSVFENDLPVVTDPDVRYAPAYLARRADLAARVRADAAAANATKSAGGSVPRRRITIREDE